MNFLELKSRAPRASQSGSAGGAEATRLGRTPRLLLTDNSFARCQALSMSQGRLRFDVKVDRLLREAEFLSEAGGRLAALAARAAGPATRVTLDCPAMASPKLSRFLDAVRDRNPSPGTPPRWTTLDERVGGRYPSEGSSLLLAGMELEQLFGFVHVGAVVQRDPGEVSFCASVHQVSVFDLPERADAYTADLALAAGILVGDILVALYSSVPHATTIVSEVHLDSDAPRETFVAGQIHRALARRIHHVNLQKRRPSVTAAPPTLQACCPEDSASP
jgi:hypothetical protein